MSNAAKVKGLVYDLEACASLFGHERAGQAELEAMQVARATLHAAIDELQAAHDAQAVETERLTALTLELAQAAGVDTAIRAAMKGGA